MKRRQFVSGLGALALAMHACATAAQAVAGAPAVGLLDAGERHDWWDAFKQQLRQLGYVEGRNIRFEERYAKGNLDELPALARQLVQLKVAVIVTGGSAAALAVERASRKVPIVMASGGDQVSRGLASSLAHPGGNVTGVTSLTSDLMVKRFELLREIVPKSARIAALWHADNPSMTSVKELDGAAAKARVAFESVRVRDAAELPEAFAAMARARVDAVVVIHGPLFYSVRTRIAELAQKHRLPAISGAAEFADAGGLVAFGPSYPDLYRRAAFYVDKILRGANPGDLPIEQPTTFELVVNLKAARALGLNLPPSLLARASRVIQ